MRKLILYAAMSLDGFLADKTGGMDWLVGDGSSEDDMPWYEEFYETVDTVLMGKNTYEQILNEFSPGIWMYGDKKTYVFTHEEREESKESKECKECKEISYTNRNPKDLLQWLKHRKGKDIWLCGGADLIAQFMADDLVDEYHLTIVPTMLGEGTRIFHPEEQEKKLFLQSMRNENGMVDLVYTRRND